jgi:dTDP-4-amino-4,6-dideoxygalactose transaminase
LQFTNLRLSFSEKWNIEKNILKVLNSAHFLNSTQTDLFEKNLSRFIGTDHAVSCANGTDALYLALASLDLPMGTEVIMASNCGNYSASMAVRLGLVPVFVDIEYSTGQLDVNLFENALSKRSGALIVTHLYGIAHFQLQKIKEFCQSRNIKLIEDVAQAAGGLSGQNRLGTFGDLSTFSFYPTKNLGALGDAGAILTSDDKLAERLRMLKQYGWGEKYNSILANGINSRLDEIQASVLNYRLIKLDKANKIRQKIIDSYQAAINSPYISVLGSGLQPLNNVGHLAILRSTKIAKVKKVLDDFEIPTSIHYPIPDHLQISMQNKFKISGSLKNTELLAKEILSIPIYPSLKKKESSLIKKALERASYELG